MPDFLKTLLLNPPSFENFDGGASSRWPATREIESYWYPVWLTYPAGMIPGSRLLDASPHKINWQQTIEICKDYEFLVLFTSTVGFASDVKLIRKIKEVHPSLKIAFVGPHGHIKPDETLMASEDIDFVTRGEFDHSVVEYAKGKPLSEILGVSYRQDGKIVHTATQPQLHTAELDALPFATEVYKRDLKIENYNIPFLLHPYVSFYTSRGCPALCTFCHWPQTLSGHAWRVRSTDNVVAEFQQAMKLFPQAKEFFFDDDTFNIRKDRVLDVCSKLKPLGFRWSANARTHTDYDTLKGMADAGCRLLIVGFESGDAQILKNSKKVGIIVHADFIIGLPGETKETIAKTIDYAKQLDADTVQVSVAHAYPGTELYQWAAANGYLATEQRSDTTGHQLPHLVYPGLSLEEMMAGMNTFYDSYYLRPHVVWRIVKKALWDSHERKRLYGEAVEYLRVRSERWKYVRNGATQPGTASQPIHP